MNNVENKLSSLVVLLGKAFSGMYLSLSD